MLAPVVLFVYNRKEHTQQTLEALEKNYLSEESDLFVFSDGPKENSAEKVSEVRTYLDAYVKHARFKQVTIIKAEKNKGLANSIISGVTQIINKYGKVIVVEDDLVTSMDFLQYMNQALEFYENEACIWSISGFNFPLKTLKKYEHDIFYTYRGCSIGWGTWLNRWETVDWNVMKYTQFLNDKKWKKRFCRGGKDLPQMLINQMENGLDSWAVRWVFEQSNQNKYTIYPKISRLKNIGFDGTGIHSEIESSYDTFISNGKLEVNFELLKPEKRIVHEFNRRFEYTLRKKIKRRINLVKEIANKYWRHVQ